MSGTIIQMPERTAIPASVKVGDAVITPFVTRARVIEVLNDDECRIREDGVCGSTMLVYNRVLLVGVSA